MELTGLLIRKKYRAGEQFIGRRAPIRAIPDNHIHGISFIAGDRHIHVEKGSGKVILFAHGLFGGIYNVLEVFNHFSNRYRMMMPYLPMYDLPLKEATVPSLGDYLSEFFIDQDIQEAVIIGSSMGGGSALFHSLSMPETVSGLVLCGSSGLSNIPLSTGFFKRKNFDYVLEATRDIFYDRSVPPIGMVWEVFNTIQDYETVLRAIRLTKSATNNRMDHLLPSVTAPALLVWGMQDPITVPEVALRFQHLLPDAELHYIPECGHVPTQEKPEAFIPLLENFLSEINY